MGHELGKASYWRAEASHIYRDCTKTGGNIPSQVGGKNIEQEALHIYSK